MNDFDVIIVGAGISGIDAAYHLQHSCPDRTFTLLEAREDIGGTWDLFRYPGIRSDSDMHTLGFGFKPWLHEKSIADGPSILSYLRETATENEIMPHIRFQHRVVSADWSSERSVWVVRVRQGEGEELVEFRCNFLFMCGGYYNYERAYDAEIEGIDDFEGDVVHPQFWPEDLDYRDKKVVVIGSGATAVTLVPAMAEDAKHVTMLQRSPTYFVSRSDRDWMANTLRKVLPDRIAYGLTRFKNIRLQHMFYNQARTKPEKVKKKLLQLVEKALRPADIDVDRHFTPSYNPWEQRLCLVPNADLFEAINRGDASVVTDHIRRVTASGIELESGEFLEADLIVTATGLELTVLSGAEFKVDGRPVDFSETYTYKGMMFSGVPNLLQTFGYVNASWTLRADLNAEFVCRLLNHMKSIGVRQVTPTLRDEDADMDSSDWIDKFTPNYMRRVMHRFPKQGDRAPWRNTQDYAADKKMVRFGPIDDGRLVFSGAIAREEGASAEGLPAKGDSEKQSAA